MFLQRKKNKNKNLPLIWLLPSLQQLAISKQTTKFDVISLALNVTLHPQKYLKTIRPQPDLSENCQIFCQNCQLPRLQM